MSKHPLVPLTEMADIHDYLREPVSQYVRNTRLGAYPYYGATGQVGWIDEYKQDGKFVLLGEDGAPFLDPYKPKAYVVEGKCWVNNHAHVLKGKDGICDDDFLCYALNWADYTDAVTGSTRLKLPQNMMDRLLIPKPDIGTQRIVALQLKAQLSTLETAEKIAKIQLDETFRLADAIVMQSVSERTSRYSLGDALIEVKDGVGKTWADFPVLGATRTGLAPAKEPPGKHAVKYKPVFPGTVFYNPMRILIGSIAFVDDDDQPGITSPDYVALQGREGVVDPRWFYYWLRSPLGVQCINMLARGAVRERMLFNRLAEGVIELPSYTVQQKAALALRDLRLLRTAVQDTLEEINLLSNKILTRAFGD